MKTYRISKYDPQNRDSNGNYVKDEWTSISDIGRNIGGNLITADEYLVMEDEYVNFITKIIQFLNLKVFSIHSLEQNDLDKQSILITKDLVDLYSKIEDDTLIMSDDLANVIRLNLREYLWCIIESDIQSIFSIKFGYDYYMYLTTTLELGEVSSFGSDKLYIENYSPN